MELRNRSDADADTFLQERAEVVQTWETGKDVNFEEGVRYQAALPEKKRLSSVLAKARPRGVTLRQPRAGVALVDEHIALLKFLSESWRASFHDLMPIRV